MLDKGLQISRARISAAGVAPDSRTPPISALDPTRRGERKRRPWSELLNKHAWITGPIAQPH